MLAARELGFTEATCDMWAQDPSRLHGSAYTAERKTEFFEVLERTNSVAAAAKSLGFNVQTAFNWAYTAGAVTRKPHKELTTRQQVLAPQKTEFLRILTRIGNISEASRRAGVKRSQGDSWAMAVGIQNVPLLDGKREKFFRLLARGISRKEATERMGINRKTVYRWEHAAQTLAANRAAPPETLMDAYNHEMSTVLSEIPDLLAIVKMCGEGPDLPPAPGARRMGFEDQERQIDPRCLTVEERVRIADMLRAGGSARAIARVLGVIPAPLAGKSNATPTPNWDTSLMAPTGCPPRPGPDPSKVSWRYPGGCVSS